MSDLIGMKMLQWMAGMDKPGSGLRASHYVPENMPDAGKNDCSRDCSGWMPSFAVFMAPGATASKPA
jgi:hypothetical protein